jgi:hypothetical protein
MASVVSIVAPIPVVFGNILAIVGLNQQLGPKRQKDKLFAKKKRFSAFSWQSPCQ